MERDLTFMIDVLGQILQAQQELLPISEEKRQLLVESKPERLGELGSREMKVLSRINSLEKDRIRSLGEVAITLGKIPRAITINDLIGIAPQDQKEKLEQLQHDIVAAVEAQNAINKLNKTLLETHIEYTEIVLSAFVGPEDDVTQYYDRSGNADIDGGAAMPGLFETQA